MRLLAGVQGPVLGELAGGRERLAAVATRKPFDSQVSGNVALEVGGAEEGLAARVARVALHVVVYAHVLVEGADQWEGGPALVADVGPLAAVLADVVSHQTGRLPELLPALRAQVRLLAGVDPHVDLQVPLAGDFHAADVAGDAGVGVDGSSTARSVGEQLMRAPGVSLFLGKSWSLKLHWLFRCRLSLMTILLHTLLGIPALACVALGTILLLRKLTLMKRTLVVMKDEAVRFLTVRMRMLLLLLLLLLLLQEMMLIAYLDVLLQSVLLGSVQFFKAEMVLLKPFAQTNCPLFHFRFDAVPSSRPHAVDLSNVHAKQVFRTTVCRFRLDGVRLTTGPRCSLVLVGVHSGRLARVRLPVALQLRVQVVGSPVSEGLPAVAARVRHFPSVHPHVDLQVAGT